MADHLQNIACAISCVNNITRNLFRGHFLLLHRVRDKARHAFHLLHNAGDLFNIAHRICSGADHIANLQGNLFRGLGGLVGQRLHLTGHHGKALASLARPRCLNSGIERQQVGLLGNFLNEANNTADGIGVLG